MARLPYQEDQSIHSMSTRQLRQYIADQAEEAQKRLDTAPKETTRAFDEIVDIIEGRAGKVKKSTSYMSKAEMREYAYTLRTFNRMDTESGYAAKTDWEKNKKRYEKFIKNQVDKNEPENQYWKKYILPSGRVSKKGYQEYKDFIAVLKASEEYMKSFGYRDIDQYMTSKKNNLDPDNKILSRTLARVYRENKGKGLKQSELLDEFKEEYDKELAKLAPKEATKVSKIPTPKTKKTSSKSTIKTKEVGKMRTRDRVHNRQT